MSVHIIRLLMLGLACLLAACGGDHGKIRYKLALEVEVDGDIKRGFSTVELSSWVGPRLTPEMAKVNSAIKGEALVLDLGHGRLLVALLTSTVNTDLAETPGRANDWPPLHRAYGTDPRDVRDAAEDMRRYRSYLGRGPREISPRDLPTLVTFGDAKDPKTVELVDRQNLSKSLGSGVRLVRATIEVTNEPITTGIEKKLPWLTGLVGHLDGNRYKTIKASNSLANSIDGSDFRGK